MDFTTFKDKLLNEDLKSVKPKQEMLDRILAKYGEVELLGCYRLNESHTCVYFKHKLWDKMAIYRDDDWLETRVNSLKNQLPDPVMEAFVKNLKKDPSIIKVESIIPSEGIFYYYVVAKIDNKKFILHVTKEGEILLQSKFMEYTISIDDEEDEDDDDDDLEADDEELEEAGIIDDDDDDDMED